NPGGNNPVGVVGWIEPLLPLALRHLPELRVVITPKRCRARYDVGRIARGLDVQGRGARGVEARGGVIWEIQDRRWQVGEEVRRVLVNERAFPVDAAIEELWCDLDGAAHLVAAVRCPNRVGEGRPTAVGSLHAVARKFRPLDHEFGPARELLA